MEIKEMPLYALVIELESYLNEMNDGIEDKKALELIMKLKMSDHILIENMYKVRAFELLESTYEKLGDDLFKDKHKAGLQIMFKEVFNY